MGSRLRRSPLFSREKGGKERQDSVLDLFKVDSDLPGSYLIFSWPAAFCRYAVHGAPTGWARGVRSSCPSGDGGSKPPPYGVTADAAKLFRQAEYSVQTIYLMADGSVFLRYKQDFYKKKLDTDLDTMGIKIGVQ